MNEPQAPEDQEDPGQTTSRYPAGSPPPTGPPPTSPPPTSPPPAAPSTKGPSLSVLQLTHPVALILIVLGTLIPFDATMLWRTTTAWAAFAVVAAIVQLVGMVGLGGGRDQQWTVAAVGTGALVAFWVLITVPMVASTAGFCLTLGTAAAVVGTVLSPDRRW